jgi:hypothetical protein
MNDNESFSDKIIIKKFQQKDNFLIVNSDNILYMLEVENGTINTKIKNCQGDLVGINYLEEGDIVKVKGNKYKLNKFIIKKIYIKTKYIFNSESSEEYDLY